MKPENNHHDDRLFAGDLRRDEILRAAADRRLPVTVTRYGHDVYTSLRGRFSDCCAQLGTISIKPLHGDTPFEAIALQTGEQIGISFRRGRTKCLFSTIVTNDVGCDVDDVITVRWPENLQELQRRLYERVAAPLNSTIGVSLSWIADGQPSPKGDPQDWADRDGLNVESVVRPRGNQSIAGQLTNLSAGGLGVIVYGSTEFRQGEMYRSQFSPDGLAGTLEFDLQLRHVSFGDTDRWSLGFQIVGLEQTNEGQCRLAQLAQIVRRFRSQLDD